MKEKKQAKLTLKKTTITRLTQEEMAQEKGKGKATIPTVPIWLCTSI